MTSLSATKANLEVQSKELITSNSVNAFHVSFSFSSAWDGLTRTAVFKASDETRSVLLDETNQCDIPWEVLQTPRRTLYAGVYGMRDGELVLPTIWASLGTIQEALETRVSALESAIGEK